MVAVPNPDYGNGIFRRRILLRNEPGNVTGEVEDNFHAFRLRISHEHRLVTAITAAAIRYPVTHCPQASTVLQQLVGYPLTGDRRELRAHQDPGQHCTHQYDLAWLAMAQALRPTAVRQYDIVVPDERDGRREIQVFRDRRPLLLWTLGSDSRVIAPARIAGNSPFAQFGRWASDAYSGELLEAAYIAQICVFVSGARRVDFEAVAGTPPDFTVIKPGTCYAYQEERIHTGVRTAGMTRNFTDTPDQLLKFL